MDRRRLLAALSSPAPFLVVPGCTGRPWETRLLRDGSFYGTAEIVDGQPTRGAAVPTAESFLFTEPSEAGSLIEWENVSLNTNNEYSGTNFDAEFLIVHVGVVYAGQGLSVGKPTVEDGTFLFDADVSTTTKEGEIDRAEKRYAYRIQRWKKGVFFEPRSVSIRI